MKRFSLIAMIFALVTLGSCENYDFGDLNENVNGASEPNPAALMSGAMMRYATLTGRDYLTRPALYIQYQSQTQYTDEQRYNESPASWAGYYVQTLSNLSIIIEIYEDNEQPSAALLAQGSANNQIGVSKIFSALIWKRLTDSYGAVPFEAYFTDDLTPAYTSQEDIYKTVIEDLKTARDMLDPSENEPTGDLIYNGDVTKWQKFANSLILSMSMQLSEADETYAAEQFRLALNNEYGVIEEIEEEAWFNYQNTSGFENPWVAQRKADYANSKTLIDALKGRSTNDNLTDPSASHNPTSNTTYDSRIIAFSSDPEGEGLPYGRASNPAGATAAKMNDTYIWRPEAPLPFMTAAYTYLNRAEAAARDWTDESAADMLEMGIEKSYETITAHWGQADYLEESEKFDITADAQGYANARVSDAENVGYIQVIAEEKWIALFPMAFDAWSEWRRTGYPELQPSPAPVNSGEIPTRYVYPSTEQGLNATNYQEAINRLTPASDNNTSRVWWDQ